MKTRRWAAILVTPDIVGMIAFNGERTIKVESKLPADAKFLSCRFDDMKRCFHVVFEHESFKEVPFGEMLPVLEPPSITKIEGEF